MLPEENAPSKRNDKERRLTISGVMRGSLRSSSSRRSFGSSRGPQDRQHDPGLPAEVHLHPDAGELRGLDHETKRWSVLLQQCLPVRRVGRDRDCRVLPSGLLVLALQACRHGLPHVPAVVHTIRSCWCLRDSVLPTLRNLELQGQLRRSADLLRHVLGSVLRVDPQRFIDGYRRDSTRRVCNGASRATSSSRCSSQ